MTANTPKNAVYRKSNSVKKNTQHRNFFQRRVVILESVNLCNMCITYEPSPPVVAVQIQVQIQIESKKAFKQAFACKRPRVKRSVPDTGYLCCDDVGLKRSHYQVPMRFGQHVNLPLRFREPTVLLKHISYNLGRYARKIV